MKLLRELTEEVKLIEEGSSNKKFYLEGVCMQSNVKNKNGRVYPKETLQKETLRYINEKVKWGNAYGELGHPDTPNINPDRISHRFVSLTENGDNWICKALIHDTPMGNIVKTLMKEGGRLGISSRALGSLKEVNGINIVQDDLRLCTAGDIVIDPSAPDAWMQGIYEQSDWVYIPNHGWSQLIDNSRKQLIEASSSELTEIKIKIFENMLSKL